MSHVPAYIFGSANFISRNQSAPDGCFQERFSVMIQSIRKNSAEEQELKKAVFAAGIILIIGALVCFGLSLFFNHIALSVMDASNEFIHNAFTRAMIFRNCGIGLAAAGIVCLVIRFLKF